MTRARPPNRRLGYTTRVKVGDVTAHLTVNFDPTIGQPCELFIAGPKPGSAVAVLLEDAATAISVALQHGTPANALARSLARVPSGRLSPSDLADPSQPMPTQPASVLGAALIWLARLTGDLESPAPMVERSET